MARRLPDAEHVQAAFTEALASAVRRRFACDLPRGMRVDVQYDPSKLAHMLRVSWPISDFSRRGGEMKCLDLMVDDEKLYSDSNTRAIIHHGVMEHPAFVVGVLCGRMPEKIAAQVKAIDKKLDTMQLVLRFHNGHTCTIDDDPKLSEYDHANLLMVYNLPPI